MPVVLFIKNPSYGCGYESHLGWSDMVYSFFSSLSYNLEGQGKWGSRFPKLLIDLCDHGVVAYEDLDALDKELGIAFRELQKFPLSAAVYDIQEPWLPIPWEATPGEIANLAYAWATPRGNTNYFMVFAEYIRMARKYQTCVTLIYPSESSDVKKGLYINNRIKRSHDYWTKDRGKSVPKG